MFEESVLDDGVRMEPLSKTTMMIRIVPGKSIPVPHDNSWWVLNAGELGRLRMGEVVEVPEQAYQEFGGAVEIVLSEGWGS